MTLRGIKAVCLIGIVDHLLRVILKILNNSDFLDTLLYNQQCFFSLLCYDDWHKCKLIKM